MSEPRFTEADVAFLAKCEEWSAIPYDEWRAHIASLRERVAAMLRVDDGRGMRVENVTLCVRGDTAVVEMEYPRSGKVSRVEVGMMCVRSADDLRIEYDFDRDGWSVQQASTFEWAPEDDVFDPDWQEVAFVPAWGRERPMAP